MVALIAGVLTLLGYLGIRETFFSGPFYLLAPLPFCITYFWYKCEDRFKTASMVSITSVTNIMSMTMVICLGFLYLAITNMIP